MRKLLLWLGIAIILALAIQMYQMPSTDTSVQESYLKQDEIEESNLEEDYVQPHETLPIHDEDYDPYAPYIEELDSPVARASSSASSSKASRPPYERKFAPLSSSSVSSVSSTSFSSSSELLRFSSSLSVENKPSYCYSTGTGWLSVYSDQGAKDRALKMKPRICR